MTKTEPIAADDAPSRAPELAIIGYACQLPGARSPEAFWNLLQAGRSEIRPMGGKRWSARAHLHPDPSFPGRSYTDAAALIEGIWEFDPGFFGMSAREAEQMDPQQRLLLMAAWEAIEDAGLTPARLSGGRTGVYVGASAMDHSHGFLDRPERIDAPFMTGNTLSILANRLSHSFDLSGPSFTVDTACSSSLVALDLAARALADGDVDLALVGGVQALLSPAPFIGFSRAGMLSPSGSLRAFDAGADGYVRGEGVVVVALARAETAMAEGDRVRAKLLSTAVNTTGRAGGLTRPNAARQSRVMEQALERAGLGAEDIAFVEAHGTGTPVGDPIEAQAIGQALGRRREAVLPIGSVKPNIGHLEPASGLAGLVKACLALEHGELPPSIGVASVNPEIDAARLNIQVAMQAVSLPSAGAPAALVNSFGFGGANASAVLSAHRERTLPALRPARMLVISAASAAALERQISAWQTRAQAADEPETAALMNAAAHRRARLPHRAVLPSSPGDLSSSLTAPNALRRGTAPVAEPKLVFAFAGNGSQYLGMGSELYAQDTAYRQAYDEVADCFAEIAPQQDPRRIADDDPDALRDATRAQPALFALQVALTKSLAAHGLTPEATVGHSVGEIAAAWAAGALSLPDAVRLIASRGPLLNRLEPGGMLAVRAGSEQVSEAIVRSEIEGLELSGINSPRSVTLSGPSAALAGFQAFARRERIAARPLDVAYPYHSSALNDHKDAFFASMGSLHPTAAAIPFASSAAGDFVSGADLDLAFWWENVRAPVAFQRATSALGQAGHALYLEISPRPVLRAYIEETLASDGRPFAVLATLDRRGPGARPDDIVADAIAHGAEVCDTAVFGPPAPFQAAPPAHGWCLATYRAAPPPADPHPFLGPEIAAGADLWETPIDTFLHPWLKDHKIDGRPTLPAAVFAEIAFAALEASSLAQRMEVADLDLLAPLVLDTQDSRQLRTRIDRAASQITIESRNPSANSDWLAHLRASFRPEVALSGLEEVETLGMRQISANALYRALAEDGLHYGPDFRRVERLDVSGDGTGRAEFTKAPPPSDGLTFDPTSLDAAFHALHPAISAALPGEGLDGDLLLPRHIRKLWRADVASAASSARFAVRRVTRLSVDADVTLVDHAGRVTLDIRGLRLDRVARHRDDPPRMWHETWAALTPIEAPLPGKIAEAVTAKLSQARLLAAANEGASRSDGTVLLEALMHRLAWDKAKGETPNQPDSSAHTPPPSQSCPPDQSPAAGPTCPYPETHEIVSALLARAPEEAQRLRRVLAAADGSAGASTVSALGPSPADPEGQALDRALRCAADALLGAWPVGRRLAVLVLGEVASSLSARLRGAPAITLLDHEIHGDRRYDVVLCAACLSELPTDLRERLRASLRPNAVILCLETEATELRRLTLSLGGSSPGEANLASGPRTRYGRALGLQSHASWALTGDAAPSALRLYGPREIGEAAGQAPPCAEYTLRSDGAPPELAAALEPHLANRGQDQLLRLLPSRERSDAASLAEDLDLLRADASGDWRQIWVCIQGRRTGDPRAAALRGAARTAVNEGAAQDLRIAIIDPALCPAAAAKALTALISGGTDETEVAITGEGCFAPRLAPLADALSGAASPRLGARLRRLALGRRGDLGTLRWEIADRRALAEGEIEIEVVTTGLNFRDIMWAQAALPEAMLAGGFVGPVLGMECAGIVRRTGKGAQLQPGARVVAIAPNAFASHVVTQERAVMPLPEHMSFAEGAALPVATLTAEYALGEVAKLEPGEQLLIHGGAGAVGLAALHYARDRGASVIATAGSADKRDLLMALGAAAALDSRSLDFAERVLHLTDGRGANVILNCLTGHALTTSLACLAPFGRFIELGKRDFLENSRIALASLAGNRSFTAVDADALLAGRPAVAERLLKDVTARIQDDRAALMPLQHFAAEEVSSAFRLMQAGGHIGKVLVAAPAAPEAGTKQLSGAWLIIGTGGLAVSLAEWLAEHGAGPIWLASRSGRPTADVAPRLERLKAKWPNLRIEAADVTDRPALERLISQVAEAGEIRGVVHAAMHLEDGAFASQSAQSWRRVLEPKIDGAQLLDELTRAHAPEHFLLLGSVAAEIGNPGQAAYAAANAAIAAVAERRRAEGCSALSVALGPVDDAGHIARDPVLRERLAHASEHGGRPVGAVLQDLGRLLDAPDLPAQVCLAPMPWAQLKARLPALSAPRFERLDMPDARTDNRGPALREQLEGLPHADALEVLTAALAQDLREVLRQGSAELDPHRPLLDLGLDSLMSVDLRIAIETSLGSKLPMLTLRPDTTLADLARQILSELRCEPGDARDPVLDGLVSQHLVAADDDLEKAELAKALAEQEQEQGKAA